MPLADLPVLGAGLGRVERDRRIDTSPDGIADWDAWWQRVAQDPALRAATEDRRAVFATNYPTEEFSPPAEWHIAALCEAGFAEAGVVWRSGTGAVVAASR